MDDQLIFTDLEAEDNYYRNSGCGVYVIQCRDITSGAIGSFVISPGDEGDGLGGFIAVSPVFLSLLDLFTWANDLGISLVFARDWGN
jgi:hypothetical protein